MVNDMSIVETPLLLRKQRSERFEDPVWTSGLDGKPADVIYLPESICRKLPNTVHVCLVVSPRCNPFNRFVNEDSRSSFSLNKQCLVRYGVESTSCLRNGRFGCHVLWWTVEAKSLPSQKELVVAHTTNQIYLKVGKLRRCIPTPCICGLLQRLFAKFKNTTTVECH